MKSFKILVAAAAMVTMMLSGCQKEVVTGIDPSKAAVKDFTYDEDNSSATSVAFYWDAQAALNDGATSFSVQLASKADFSDVDMYDSKKGITVQASASINDAVTFSALKEYDVYFARVRANYPRSVYSEWAVLTKDGETACVSVGHGIVVMSFGAPQNFKAEAPTYSSIKVSWSVVGLADKYVLEYKKADASTWTVLDASPLANATITGTDPETSYDVRVKAIRTVEGVEEASDYSTASVTTPAKPVFNPSITTADQFVEFLADIAAVAGATDSYTLDADIDLTGKTIVSASAFGGIFDGKGHTIKNLTLDQASLFAENSGTIKNFILDASCQVTLPAEGNFGAVVISNSGTVEGITCKAVVNTPAAVTAALNLGVIVGISTGLVKNCTNNSNLVFNLSDNAGSHCIGGVLGRFECAADAVAVENCTNTGTVKFQVAGTPKNNFIGGVVGSSVHNAKGASPAINLGNYGVVKGCTNSGAVSQVWGISNSGSYCNIGGVAGYIEGSIEDCSNTAAVSISSPEDPSASSTRPCVAGVAGYVTINAKNCFNKGAVSARGIYAAGTEGNNGAAGTHQPLFGGVFGGVGDNYQAVSAAGVLENCYNEGDLDFVVGQKVGGGTVSKTGGVAAYSTVEVKNCHNSGAMNICLGHKTSHQGGVIGQLCNNISDCYNEGVITINSAGTFHDADAVAASQQYCGGIAGYTQVAVAYVNCENKATGKITFTNGWNTAALSYVGGIQGSYNKGNTMTSCKNAAAILVDTPSAMCVGGLCGAFNGTMSSSANSGTVTVKNAGAAAGKENETGGMAGYANATFTGCSNTGDIVNEAAGSFTGGIAGGFGAADSTWDSNTVDCTITSVATKGYALGRYRSAGAFTLTWTNGTLGAGVSGLAGCGNLNGCTFVN